MSAPATADWGTSDKPVAAGEQWGHSDKPVNSEKPLGEQDATLGGAASVMANQAKRFIGAAWENLSPMNLIRAGLHPVDTAHAAFGATVDALDRTQAALKKGDHAEALTSMVGAIPLLGPAGEQIVREIRNGQGAEALGHAAGLRLALEAPKAIPAIVEGAPAAASKVAAAATRPAVLKTAGAGVGGR